MESTLKLLPLEELYSNSERKILLEAFEYDQNLPKLQVVNIDKLIGSYNFWLKITKEKCDLVKDIWILAKGTQDIHDKLDYSIFEPKKHRPAQDEFGVPLTIASNCFSGLAATYKSLQISKNGPKICLKHAQNVLRSQFMNLIWKENMACPSEEEYLKNCVRRQRNTFYLIFDLMQECSTTKINLTNLLEIFAQFFQICEDYLIVSDIENRYCEDYLTEGIICFPIVHALRSEKGNSEIANLFYKKVDSIHLKKYLFTLLKNGGHLEYTKNVLIKLRVQAEQELKKIEENPLILRLMEDALSDFIGIV